MNSPLEKLQADAAATLDAFYLGDITYAECAAKLKLVPAQVHALGVAQGLEEAAKVCTEQHWSGNEFKHRGNYACAAAIRALKPKRECGCWACTPEVERVSRMIVCDTCGNKRCPHGTDHRLACTNSNDPEQPGSRYGGLRAPQPAKEGES